jgi:hypothetical protein
VNGMGGEANVEVLWRELLRLLEEEIAAVEAAFAEEMKVQEEKDAIERDARSTARGQNTAPTAARSSGFGVSVYFDSGGGVSV